MATRIVIALHDLPPPRRAVAGTLSLIFTLLLGGCATVPIGSPVAPRGDETAGRLVLESGRTFRVYPDDLRFTGQAEYRWPDGRSYRGQWLAGQPHGEGEEILPDGETYSGVWQAGLRQGLGELLPAGGGLYQGEFRAGRRHGRGVQFSDEGVYQGDWLDDREHGHGELAGVLGSRYTGEWRAGLRAGQGTYRGADGSSYQGEWLNDQPHGFGLFESATGALYAGEWRAGRQHGIGRLQAPSGLVYEGAWEAAERHGFGVEQRPDGSRYAGEWDAGRRHGQGRESWPDGSFHEGSWTFNQPLGPGHRRYATGIEIRGAWTGGHVSSGLLSLPDGREYAGPLFRDAGTRVSPRLLAWLEDTATRDAPHASLLVGVMHLDYVEPAPDQASARGWLTRAAEAGLAEAQYRLGVLALAATPADAAALAWLQQAATQGHADANRLLGDFHAIPAATDRLPGDRPRAATGAAAPDAARAMAHYQRAIEAGSSIARDRLARLLVTTPDPGLRDPDRAVALIEPYALYREHWLFLDTLALAYAAAGDRIAAALAQERAIAAATPPPGADVQVPTPSSGTPAPAASPLISRATAAPDIEAMRDRLADYRQPVTDSRNPRQMTPINDSDPFRER